MRNHYLFGYGSLINSESRKKTGVSGAAVPARARGLRRAWNYPIPKARATAVDVEERTGATCNGVVISMSEGDLSAFDKRENEVGYQRARLDRNVLTLLDGDLEPETFWIYIGESSASRIPTEETPIIQSYVDVILAGCLSFGEPFAREFVLTTANWEFPWIDDRAAPRYPRWEEEAGHIGAGTIDGILEELIPEAFRRRKESA